MLVRLHPKVQAMANEQASTSSKVKKMLELVFGLEEETSKREKGADNLVTLARERVGAELLHQQGVVPKIVRIMKVEKNPKIRLSLVRVFGDLGRKDMERARTIVKEAGVPFFLDALNSNEEDTVNAVSYVIQMLLDSLSRIDLMQKWVDKVLLLFLLLLLLLLLFLLLLLLLQQLLLQHLLLLIILLLLPLLLLILFFNCCYSCSV